MMRRRFSKKQRTRSSILTKNITTACCVSYVIDLQLSTRVTFVHSVSNLVTGVTQYLSPAENQPKTPLPTPFVTFYISQLFVERKTYFAAVTRGLVPDPLITFYWTTVHRSLIISSSPSSQSDLTSFTSSETTQFCTRGSHIDMIQSHK